MDFDRIHRDVYIRRGVALDPLLRAEAAALFAGTDGIVGGLSAAALHGAKWIDGEAPGEIFRTGSRRPVPGLLVHADALEPDEFEVVGNSLVTTAARTAYDLGRRPPLVRAVEMLDDLCRATALDPSLITLIAERHPGTRHIVQLRRAVELVDSGAESPQETRTRLVLIDGGLPAPETQIRIHGPRGTIIARADMGWSRWKVAVEYDGSHHWTDEGQRAWDIERSELLDAVGWTIIRVSSERLRLRPASIVLAARRALRAAGADV